MTDQQPSRGAYQGRHRAEGPNDVAAATPADRDFAIRLTIVDLVHDLAAVSDPTVSDTDRATHRASVKASFVHLGQLAAHDPEAPADPGDGWCIWYPLTCHLCAILRTLRGPCDHAHEPGHECTAAPAAMTPDGRFVPIDQVPPVPRWLVRWFVACETGDRDAARALWASLPSIMPAGQLEQVVSQITAQLGYAAGQWAAAGRPLLDRPWGADVR